MKRQSEGSLTKTWRRHGPIAAGAVCALAMAISLPASPAKAAIRGDIVRVGYPGLSGPAIRAGCWTPVVVDLALEGQPSFTGWLRVRQSDRDGDLYDDVQPVQLFADTGAQRRYTLYTVAKPQVQGTSDLVVELLASEDGSESNARLVDVVTGGGTARELRPSSPPEFLEGDTYLVLHVYDGPMGRVRELRSTVSNSGDYDRPVEVAHIGTNDLPPRWLGFAMVDAIVWDEADPTQLSESQQQALVEWVHEGGRLVIAAARTADVLAQSPHFAPILPVKFEKVISTDKLPDTKLRLLRIVDDTKEDLDQPIPLALCKVVDDPDVRSMLDEPAIGGTVVATRRVGRGVVVYVAASLTDLLRGDAPAREAYQRLLELRRNPLGGQTVQTRPLPLFRFLEQATGFYSTGSAYLAIALLFAVVYVLVGTLGAWKYLSIKNRLKHSWTAMAVVAIIGSVASIIGVQAIHGVGRKVHELSIVDGTAGSVDARATVYFGLTTGVHSKIDAWMPQDPLLAAEPQATACTLKPLLALGEFGREEQTFTDPARYRLEPTTAQMLDIPVRATLKQFEGRWSGQLRGTISASVALTRMNLPRSKTDASMIENTVLTRDSWLRNDLGVDLNGCYLLIAQSDVYTPQTFMTIAAQRANAGQIRAYPIGEIKDSERINLFDRVFLSALGNLMTAEEHATCGFDNVERDWGQPFMPSTLNPFSSLDERLPYELEHYEKAVLLLTVASDVDPSLFKVPDYMERPVFSRERCRQLDLSQQLTRDSAVFVGFSRTAGPARLCVGSGGKYAPVEPQWAATVYRFVIPVRR